MHTRSMIHGTQFYVWAISFRIFGPPHVFQLIKTCMCMQRSAINHQTLIITKENDLILHTYLILSYIIIIKCMKKVQPLLKRCCIACGVGKYRRIMHTLSLVKLLCNIEPLEDLSLCMFTCYWTNWLINLLARSNI